MSDAVPAWVHMVDIPPEADMDCIGDYADTIGAITRCAEAYGGPGWVSLAMTGAAAVVLAFFVLGAVYWLLAGLRR